MNKSSEEILAPGSIEPGVAVTTAAEKKVSHDTEPPPALIDFMLRDWRKPSGKLPKALSNHKAFAVRRQALSAHFPGETLIIPTGHEKVRSNDTTYRFRAGSDFYYLTGNLEPDCVVVLEPTGATGHNAVLFVEPNPGHTDKTFFTDRMKGELWVGPRMGIPESAARFGLEARGLPDLPGWLSARNPATTRVLRNFSDRVDGKITGRKEADAELATVLSEMRLLKDAQEIRELQAVVDSTQRGFEDVIRRLKTAKGEREAEGVFNLRARMEGDDVGYGTIAAGGAHACILHWTRNDGPLKKGDLLLLDAGVEGKSLYTADITRTLPVSGKFSREQREIYDLVFEAQTLAMAQVKPGNDFMEPNRAAMRVLAEGLNRLGILKTSADDALKDEHQFYKRYSLHNVSHMLGIDVHDCAAARQEAYKFGKLKAGMVLTVEPGLYFQMDDLTVPAKYRGIGVRIEDDVVVTAKGYRNLSAGIPRESKEVEAWMKRLWAKKE